MNPNPINTVLVSVILTAIISILATIAATQHKAGRQEGQDAERVINLAKDLGAAERRIDQLVGNINALGAKLRKVETILDIATHTGEVPKYRVSGERESTEP